ncbi:MULTISPECIES: hypothetical protein [Actinomyces]|jgi:hypothetical protein avisC_05013|uniref:hypothetical protein n=1 Tax=Actinomyces TaxID=1654 RepID=UPI0028E704C1|nr:hypothetical protein [Actinomyces oris]
MTRSRVSLPGHRRVASALGAGVLAASLALAGCSSSNPKGGGTIPPLNTAGASAASTTAPAASGGASAGASGAASAGAVTAESLSDPDLGYTVVSIPQGLDATQTKVLQDYVAYDKATWRVWSTREGLDEALGRTTGAAQVTLQNTYDSMTDQDNPPMKVGVGDIEVSKDAQTADVTVCLDRTQVTNTDFQGNDVTNKERQRRVKIQVHMVPDDSGVWVTENEKKLSFNECTTESGK